MGAFLYALAWLLFALFHSLLARQTIQVKIESRVGRWYRLLYNLFALVQITLVLALGRYAFGTNRFAIFETTTFVYVVFALQWVGVVIFIVALTKYDIGRFAGITQLFTGEKVSSTTNEPLQRNGLNRFMRHPLYTGAFLMLWGNGDTQFGLWTAIWGSVYLVIGTVFEERKLIRIYGEDYQQYQQEVPRYFPSI